MHASPRTKHERVHHDHFQQPNGALAIIAELPEHRIRPPSNLSLINAAPLRTSPDIMRLPPYTILSLLVILLSVDTSSSLVNQLADPNTFKRNFTVNLLLPLSEPLS